jgi:IS30 family transposase
MKNFKHFSYEERIVIETLLKEGKSLRYIARQLERSPNSVSYEIRRNKVKEEYIPKKANHKAYFTRYYSKRDCLRVVLDKEIRFYVDEKLKLSWSPETISGRLKNEGKLISSKAIYKYIYSRYLEKYLFWNIHKKKSRKRKKDVYLKDTRKFIDERGLIEGLRHYEMDFIVSSHNKEVLLVIVDKVSRKTKCIKLRNRKHKSIERELLKHCSNAQSITTDNDIAFKGWKRLEKKLNTKIYFTNPYCSWEKGLVENTNRWIRADFPTKTDFRKINLLKLENKIFYLNNTPRKILGFKTANEVELEMQVS